MFNFLTQLVRPISPRQVVDLPPPPPADLDSLSDFAQAVAEKLHTEAGQLPSGPGIPLFRGAIPSFLDTVPEYLSRLPPNQWTYHPSQERLLVLLDCLEDLCQVRPRHPIRA